MDNQELQKLVEELSLIRFHKPFLHQATFNHRLRTTGGLYYYESHNLEFNPKILERYDKDELIAVIVHELCHYHLHLEGKGHQHRDKDFKQLLKKTGGTRYVKRLVDYNYLYRCTKCHMDYYRYRKMDLNKLCCGKCHSKLEFVRNLKDNKND